MRSATYALFVVSAVLCSTVAAVQAEEPNSRIPPKDERALPPDRSSGSTTTPDAGAPGSLSDELNRTGGVIRPPPTGDRGAMPPPSVGEERMPVIPPPGSPGGNERVQPK
jgi:hypothetical protein